MNQKTMLVASDVIAGLKGDGCRRLNATGAGYLYIPLQVDTKDIGELQSRCSACAVGAMFISTAKCVHGDDAAGLYRRWQWGINRMFDDVAETFAWEQIGLIECAFMKKDGYMRDHTGHRVMPGQPLANRAASFGWAGIRGIDPQKRMTDIMQNILDNDGLFCP